MKTLNLSIWAVLLFAFLLSGCKKDWEEPISERAESAAELTARVYRSEVEEAFFSMEPQNEETIAERSLQPIVIDANNALYELNLVEDFVTLYHEQLGIPEWSKGLASQDELLWVPVYKDGAVNGILGVVRADSSLYFRPFFRPLYSKLSAIKTPQSVPLILWLFDYFDTAEGLGGDDELDFRNCPDPCGWENINNQFGHTIFQKCLCSGITALPVCCENSSGPIMDGGVAEAGGDQNWLFNFLDLLRSIFGDNGDFDYDDPLANYMWFDYIWNLWINGGLSNQGNNGGGGSSSNMNSEQRKVRLLRALLNEQFVYDWLIDRLELPIGEDGFSPYHIVLGGNPQISGPLYLFLNGFYDDVLPDPKVAMGLLDLIIDFGPGSGTGGYTPPLDLTQAEMEHILGFENGLIADICSFLEANPNSAEAIQAVHDLMALQMCSMAPNNIGCQTTNYDNDLPLLLDFYSGLSQEAYDWFHSTDITNAGLKHIGLDFLLNGEMTPDADRKQHLAAVTEWAASLPFELGHKEFGWLLENLEGFGEIKEFLEESTDGQEDLLLVSSLLNSLGQHQGDLESAFVHFLSHELEEFLFQEGIEWPSSPEEFDDDFWDIVWTVLKDVVPELIPGLDTFLELKSGIEAANDGDYWQSTEHLAMALLTVLPLDKVKDAIKVFKALKKSWKAINLVKKLKLLSNGAASGFKETLKKEWKNPHIFRQSPGHLPALNPLVSWAGSREDLIFKVYEKAHLDGILSSMTTGVVQPFNIVLNGITVSGKAIKLPNGQIRIDDFWIP